MNIYDILILAAVLLLVMFSVRLIKGNRKKGKMPCGCDCGSCMNNCSSHCKNK